MKEFDRRLRLSKKHWIISLLFSLFAKSSSEFPLVFSTKFDLSNNMHGINQLYTEITVIHIYQ